MITAEHLYAEHRRLENAFRDIADLPVVSPQHPVIHVLIEELVAMLRTHFLNEEQFMRQIGYPECHAHEAEHALLLHRCHAIRVELRENLITFTEAIQGIRSVILQHMKDVDSQVFPYY